MNKIKKCHLKKRLNILREIEIKANIKFSSVFISMVLMFMTLSACTPPLAYVQPRSDSSAKLKIKVKDKYGRNYWVIRFKGEMEKYNCSSQPAEVIAILNNVSIYDNYADKGNRANEVTINVPANGEKFHFLIPYVHLKLSGNKLKHTECQANVGFYPQPGKEYMAVFDPSISICKIPVFEKTQNDNFKIVKSKRYPPCLVNMGRNFARKWFVLDYYEKYPSQYE